MRRLNFAKIRKNLNWNTQGGYIVNPGGLGNKTEVVELLKYFLKSGWRGPLLIYTLLGSCGDGRGFTEYIHKEQKVMLIILYNINIMLKMEIYLFTFLPQQ